MRIVFDSNAERIDLVTGKHLPDYSHAQKGSLHFYEGRLDNEVKRINYMFASMVDIDINRVVLLRKLTHPNIWAIASKNGDTIEGLNPMMSADVVKVYAVSFIPVNPDNGVSAPRVHVLFEDLYLIQWESLDHWLANKSQAAYEAEKGLIH